MKLGLLKKLISELDDDIEVVIPCFDHTYYPLNSIYSMPALKDGNQYFEHDEYQSDIETVDVLVIE